MPVFRFESQSPLESQRLGRSFGQFALPGDLICLNGNLGAGKTTFVQGMATGLGLDLLAVISPTYSLIAEHSGGRIPLIHMDAYRLSESAELGPIGFDEYLNESAGVMVIEWSERILDALPNERLDITIANLGNSEEGRIFGIATFGGRSDILATDALSHL